MKAERLVACQERKERPLVLGNFASEQRPEEECGDGMKRAACAKQVSEALPIERFFEAVCVKDPIDLLLVCPTGIVIELRFESVCNERKELVGGQLERDIPKASLDLLPFGSSYIITSREVVGEAGMQDRDEEDRNLASRRCFRELLERENVSS